jgi:hypothetical protein
MISGNDILSNSYVGPRLTPLYRTTANGLDRAHVHRQTPDVAYGKIMTCLPSFSFALTQHFYF